MRALVLDCAGRPLDLSKPRVMGILNVTPDSFSDGGNFLSVENALAQARQMVAEGAAIIDVGGESTRPGAATVSAREELRRVLPVVQAISAELPVPVSVDTSKPEVMRQAVAAGAGMINDVRALRTKDALAMARDLGVPVCLMHMQGEPRTMQEAPGYRDVVAEVREFLMRRIQACIDAGMQEERLIVDPGFGFGKTPAHNLRLLHGLERLVGIGPPVLVGLSRKSLIGQLLGDAPPHRRLYGGLALAVLAAAKGAAIVRVHDVRPTVEALTVAQAVWAADSGQV